MADVLPADELQRVLVVGYASTGKAVASVLGARGVEIVAIDDSSEIADAGDAAVELRTTPERDSLAALVELVDLVVVSPGVPPSHPIFATAPAERVISEIELAFRLARRPIVAVTGTNAKTTVVSLVDAMLRASGIRSAATGNIGPPLISVVERDDLDVLVAEVSSFQLAYAPTFRPSVATWLNFSPNHLDWHGSVDAYRQAKAQIWAHQQKGDVAIANAEDDLVAAEAANVPARLVTFGLKSGDYRLDGEDMVDASGAVLAHAGDLVRDLPHDRLNALAALVTAGESGASRDGALEALRTTGAPPHRLQRVGEIAGVTYYDDSKATTPAAVATALAGFSSAVVILGGRNKGLDLSGIHDAALKKESAQLHGVVAIGESAPEIEAMFEGEFPVKKATSMHDAVRVAASLAHVGDSVLLSPGCASFDWYESYEARGDDFQHEVRELLAEGEGR